MSQEALHGALELLRTRIDALLSCFESERVPEPAAMDAAWAPLSQTFELVRAELGGAGELPGELRRKVADCLRLYAVAASVLAERREELVSGRAACTEARARLRRRGALGPRGGSCDVTG